MFRKRNKAKEKFRGCKVCVWMALLVVILCTGCYEDVPDMDADKCAELVMRYMKEKYNEDAELLYSKLVDDYRKSEDYVKVGVRIESGKAKNYHVTVCADGHTDADGDGYSDHYKVLSDDYMRELVQDAAKKEMEKSLKKIGLEQFEVKILYISTSTKNHEFQGFSADFPVPEEDHFSLEEIIKDYKLDIYCYLDIPESVYSDRIKTDIINEFRSKIKDDAMWFEIGIVPEKNNHQDYPGGNTEEGMTGEGTKREVKFSVKE